MIVYKGGYYLTNQFDRVKGDVVVENDTITYTGPSYTKFSNDAIVIDASGCTVIPGLIDIHTHGAGGIDIMTASPQELLRLANVYAQNGVTSFMPTTISCDMPTLFSVTKNIKEAAEKNTTGASIEGIHVEGPYISENFRGCHEARYLRCPKKDDFLKLQSILEKKQDESASQFNCHELKIRYTVAPELDGSFEFIRFVCEQGGSITLGHSGADYATAMKALTSGANGFTHLFNAMAGINHRNPGIVTCGLMSEAFAELIVDGIHISPEIVQLTYQLKGSDRLLLITDSMCAAGCGDGEFNFGGKVIKVQNGCARDTAGTIAGSTLMLLDGVKNLMNIAKISFEQALQCATINPAKAVGIDKICGSIEPGKRADLVVINDELEILMTVCSGKIVHSAID